MHSRREERTMNGNTAENILNSGFVHFVKDPLWQSVAMTKEIKDLMEVRDVQKLSRIRQNGPAYLIYPGAVHTRLSHSIGVYHLGREILLSLARKGEDLPFTKTGIMSFLTACLLHDIGHFPYAHSLKQLAVREHEEIARDMIMNREELRSAVSEAGADPLMTALIIDSKVPSDDKETVFYRKVLSGTLDPDKLDYLTRDAYFSGLTYGRQDTAFIISSLLYTKGRLCLEKEAISSVEQILFSKYMMYRTLYWHKGVRSATAMIKKALSGALLMGAIRYDEIYGLDDGEFNTLCLSRISMAPCLSLVDRVEHSDLLERKAMKDYETDGRIERNALSPESKEKMENTIYSLLVKKYGKLKEHEVIIDIPEPINFESSIDIADEDGNIRSIRDEDMVFTGEVSLLFQRRLRKTALYLPRYVETEDARRAFMEYSEER